MSNFLRSEFQTFISYRVFSVVLASLLAGCGGSSPTPVILSSITITPDPVYIGIGTTLNLTATGNYSDGTSADLTSQANWATADPTVASMSATGLLTAVSTTSGAFTTVTAALNGVTSPGVIISVTTANSLLSGNLNIARYDHTATELLAGSGVVVAGGYGLLSHALKSAELYDPLQGTWSMLPDMNIARRDHTANLLPNGKVLLLGGGGDATVNDLDSADIYDPTANSWTSYLQILNTPRSYHTATLLTNGKVLVVGGGLDNSNELYDPANPGVKAILAASDITSSGRYSHTATLLNNGSVLVTGGFDIFLAKATATAELFDPTGLSNVPAFSLATARYLQSATLLLDGRVLVAGGIDAAGNILASAELYDPSTNTWSPAASMNTPRYGQTATLMPNGQVMVIGGSNMTGQAISSVELYTPDPTSTTGGTWTPTANLQFGRVVHTSTLLGSGPNTGSVLVVGGDGGAVGTLSSVELHN